MSIIRRPTIQNTGPQRINWASPLTNGLVGAWVPFPGGAAMVNLASGGRTDTLTLSGDAVITNAYYSQGRSLYCPANGIINTTGAVLTSPSTALQPSGAVSVYWRGAVWSALHIGNNPPLVGMFYDNANGAPYMAYGINRINGNAAGLYALYNNGSAQNISYATAIDTAKYGAPMTAAMTRRSGETVLYVNGRSVASDSVAGTMIYGATCNLRINCHVTSGTDSADTSTEYALVWDRAISATEIESLNTRPDQIFSSRAIYKGLGSPIVPIIANVIGANIPGQNFAY